MSTRKRKYNLYDINVIGEQRLVDLVLKHPGYLGMIKLFEKEFAASASKKLLIKSELRSIREEFPDRPFGLREEMKDMFTNQLVKKRGYFSYIHYPSSTINKLVEYSYGNDFFNTGKVNHSLSNRSFNKLPESEKFDSVVEWLMIGGGTAAFESYLNEKLNELKIPKQAYETKTESKNLSRKKIRPIYSNLRELFINDTSFNECIDALRKVNPPIISKDNKYLLGPKQKGAFTAWFEIIKLREKLTTGVIAADVAKLLNTEIEGLNLGEDGTTLRRTATTMYRKYKVIFTKLII